MAHSMLHIVFAVFKLFHFPCQWTPLHIAAREGHTPIVAYFDKQGADMNITDKVGVSVESKVRCDGNTIMCFEFASLHNT